MDFLHAWSTGNVKVSGFACETKIAPTRSPSIRFRNYGHVFGNRSLTVAVPTRTFDPDANLPEFAKEPRVRDGMRRPVSRRDAVCSQYTHSMRCQEGDRL